jgi:hypothetical protein
MQVYCEPFFSALENWRNSKEEGILHNRFRVVETIGEIFMNFSQNPVTHQFELVCQNESIQLLPEVYPTAGKVYKVDGDQTAFTAMAAKIDKTIFQRGGVFFQDNLLKGIAGYSEEKLKQSNLETRSTIIALVDKLLRIAEEAGDVHIYCTKPHGHTTETIEIPLVELSTKVSSFFQYLVELRQGGTGVSLPDKPAKNVRNGAHTGSTAAAGKRKRTREEDDEEAEWVADNDGILWTRVHPSIGTQVAAHFPPLEVVQDLVPQHDHVPSDITRLGNTVGKLFRGKVTRYAKPSQPGMRDQLYHIRWEDGDEQDFDEVDMERGMDLYDQLEGWTTRHHSVGTQVAAYFPVPVGGRHTQGVQMEQKIFTGVVKKYGTPLSPEDVPLYHVVFEDGDEQDFNEAELKLGVELFNAHQADLDENLDFEEEKPKAKKPKPAAAKPAVKASQAKTTPAASSAVKEEKNSGRVSSRAAATSPERETKGKRGRPKGSTSSKKAGVKKESSTRKSMAEELAEVGVEEDEDDPVWTVHHDSVGKRVAQHFAVPTQKGKPKMQVFGGTVAVYAPPSAPKANDQLYHIVWDDGDEQDFDEADLKRGLALLEQLMPTDLHRLPDAARDLVREKQKNMAIDFGEVRVSATAASSSAGSASGKVESSEGEGKKDAAEEQAPAESVASVEQVSNDATLKEREDASENAEEAADNKGEAEAAADVKDSVTEDGNDDSSMDRPVVEVITDEDV